MIAIQRLQINGKQNLHPACHVNATVFTFVYNCSCFSSSIHAKTRLSEHLCNGRISMKGILQQIWPIGGTWFSTNWWIRRSYPLKPNWVLSSYLIHQIGRTHICSLNGLRNFWNHKNVLDTNIFTVTVFLFDPIWHAPISSPYQPGYKCSSTFHSIHLSLQITQAHWHYLNKQT